MSTAIFSAPARAAFSRACLAAGEWRVDDKVTVRLKAPDDPKPVVREKDGTKQLVLPVNFDPEGKATFAVETSW